MSVYMTGAAATVSFGVIAIFSRGGSEVRSYPRLDLLRWAPLRGLAHPWALSPIPRWLGVWPAAMLFLAVAWIEMAWQGGEIPRTLALLIVA